MLIDTHCHFNHARFADDLPECLERALQADVRQMIVVGFDLESSEQAIALSEAYLPYLFAAVAVHPHDAKDWNAAAAHRLRMLADHPHVVAVGEIGLDFHYDFSPRTAQETAFRAQMQIAREANLPVIIHCREAYSETLALLADEGADETGGVMHCWAGTVEQVVQATEMGLFLGFGGTLTFKSAESIRDAARRVGRELLLVETDAPYLAPVPHRGKRNEPAYTRLVAAKLAELRGSTLPEITRLTTENAQRCFPRLGG
jgi:TatD DNase family protein